MVLLQASRDQCTQLRGVSDLGSHTLASSLLQFYTRRLDADAGREWVCRRESWLANGARIGFESAVRHGSAICLLILCNRSHCCFGYNIPYLSIGCVWLFVFSLKRNRWFCVTISFCELRHDIPLRNLLIIGLSQ